MACTVPGCSNRVGGLKESRAKVSFHRFPADNELKKIWIKNVRKGDSWKSTPYTRICSDHFERSCFREGYERKILHSHAVPTIFLKRPASCQPKLPFKRKLVARYDTEVPSTSSGCENQFHGPLPKLSRRTQTENTNLANLDAELKQATKLAQHYKMIAIRRGRTLKSTQRKCQRLLKKNTDLEIIIHALYQKEEDEHVTTLKNIVNSKNQILTQFSFM